MSDYEKYKAQLAIDKHALDDNIEQQVIAFYEISDKASIALAERDAAKTSMETVEGSAYLRIRNECLEDGVKVTETMLKNMVMEDKTFVEAQKEYLNAKANADQWNVLKESFIQRGYMLREMAGLYVAGYFAEFSTKATKDTEEIQTQSRRASLQGRRRDATRNSLRS